MSAKILAIGQPAEQSTMIEKLDLQTFQKQFMQRWSTGRSGESLRSYQANMYYWGIAQPGFDQSTKPQFLVRAAELEYAMLAKHESTPIGLRCVVFPQIFHLEQFLNLRASDLEQIYRAMLDRAKTGRTIGPEEMIQCPTSGAIEIGFSSVVISLSVWQYNLGGNIIGGRGRWTDFATGAVMREIYRMYPQKMVSSMGMRFGHFSDNYIQGIAGVCLGEQAVFELYAKNPRPGVQSADIRVHNERRMIELEIQTSKLGVFRRQYQSTWINDEVAKHMKPVLEAYLSPESALRDRGLLRSGPNLYVVGDEKAAEGAHSTKSTQVTLTIG